MEITVSPIQLLFLITGRPPWVDVQMATRLKIPHTFVIHTYTKPTKCHFCTKILVGVFKQVLLLSWLLYNVLETWGNPPFLGLELTCEWKAAKKPPFQKAAKFRDDCLYTTLPWL